MTETTTIYRIAEGTETADGVKPVCVMFALCDNDATLLIPHPVLDWVFSCERCARKLGYDVNDNLLTADVSFD